MKIAHPILVGLFMLEEKNFCLDFRLVLRFPFAKNLATVQLRDKRIKIYALNSSRTRLQPDSD